MLNLKDINLTLGKGSNMSRKVLNELSLHVKQKEFVSIIGNNGAGKSTLLNVISGFMQQDSGIISLFNEDITGKSQNQRARFISKVMQDPKVGTMQNMTIFENLALAAKRGEKRGLRLFHTKERVNFFKQKLSILNMGLENRLESNVNNLSGGQRQALSLIMAVIQNFKILLLDEITAALDPSSSETIMEIANKLIRSEELSCIMITHNMKHAIKYGDRLLLMKNGNFIKEYNAQDKSLLTQMELIESF